MIKTLLLVSFCSAVAAANVPNLKNLNSRQFNDVVDELGLGLTFNSATPLSRFKRGGMSIDSSDYEIGDIELEIETESFSDGESWNLELGVVAAELETEKLEATSTTGGVDPILTSSLFVAMSLPWGLGFEAIYTPEIELNQVNIQRVGMALLFRSLNRLLWLPLRLDLRVHTMDTKLSFLQTDPATRVFFDSISYGAHVLTGFKFWVLEPYAGVGWLHMKGQLSAAESLFDSSLTSLLTVEREVDGLQTFFGLQINLNFIKFSMESAQNLDQRRLSAKFSFSF